MKTYGSWEERLKPLLDRHQLIKTILEEKRQADLDLHPEFLKVQLENAQKLNTLIEKRGFPVLSSAGEQGVRWSWFIIFHSSPQPDFMRECLTQIRLAAAAEDYPLELLAYLEDKVAILEGRRQLYGTYYRWHEGELRPFPIEDENLIDARRKKMGLPPIEKVSPPYDLMRPPSNEDVYEKMWLAWLRKVGWRV